MGDTSDLPAELQRLGMKSDLDYEQSLEFRLHLGNLTQAFVKLEASIAIQLWGLAGVTQTIGRIALPNGASLMLDLMNKLAPARIPDVDLRERTLAWTRAARSLVNRRNWFIHGGWHIVAGTGRFERMDLRPLGGDTETTSIDELKSFTQQVDDASFAPHVVELAATVFGPWSVGEGWSANWSMKEQYPRISRRQPK